MEAGILVRNTCGRCLAMMWSWHTWRARRLLSFEVGLVAGVAHKIT
jgi:hypothetical protein